MDQQHHPPGSREVEPHNGTAPADSDGVAALDMEALDQGFRDAVANGAKHCVVPGKITEDGRWVRRAAPIVGYPPRRNIRPGSPVSRGPRRRGAGRPKAHTARRSSAASGDSGDDGPGEPAPLGAIHERRVRTLLAAVLEHQPSTTEAIRNLPRVALYVDDCYEAALDTAITRGLLEEGPTGRPYVAEGVIA